MYFEIHKDSSTAMHKLLLDEEVDKVELALRVCICVVSNFTRTYSTSSAAYLWRFLGEDSSRGMARQSASSVPTRSIVDTTS